MVDSFSTSRGRGFQSLLAVVLLMLDNIQHMLCKSTLFKSRAFFLNLQMFIKISVHFVDIKFEHVEYLGNITSLHSH